MSKSIIIFGKGPSVLRCNREVVNQHDDIAIINYPVINDFFYGLISDDEFSTESRNYTTKKYQKTRILISGPGLFRRLSNYPLVSCCLSGQSLSEV